MIFSSLEERARHSYVSSTLCIIDKFYIYLGWKVVEMLIQALKGSFLAMR